MSPEQRLQIQNSYFDLWLEIDDLDIPEEKWKTLIVKAENLGNLLCNIISLHRWQLDQCGYIGHAYCSTPGCDADPRDYREEVEVLFPNARRELRGKEW